MKDSKGTISLFMTDTDRNGPDSGILVLQAVADIDFRRAIASGGVNIKCSNLTVYNSPPIGKRYTH